MNKNIIIGCLLIVSTLSSVFAQDYKRFVQVSGYIFAEDSTTTIPFVQITNSSNNMTTLSGNDGFFTIAIRPKDTLYFTAIGYKKTKYVLPPKYAYNSVFTSILMPKTVYLLPEAKINFFNYEKFVDEFEGLKLPDDSLVAGDPDYYDNYVAPKKRFGITLHPISFLYNRFSSKAKELRKLRKLLNSEDKELVATMKMNPNLIKEVTGLTNEDISKFVSYCNISTEFINQSTKYDLMVAISDCYEEFIKYYPKAMEKIKKSGQYVIKDSTSIENTSEIDSTANMN